MEVVKSLVADGELQGEERGLVGLSCLTMEDSRPLKRSGGARMREMPMKRRTVAKKRKERLGKARLKKRVVYPLSRLYGS